MTTATDTPTRPGRALAGSLFARARNGLWRVGASIRRLWVGVTAVAGPLAHLLWLRAKPALAIVSTAGWIVLVVGLASLVSGFALGWQELVYLGTTLIAAIAVCVVLLFGRSTYEVTVELNPSRVVVGDRAMGQMVTMNAGTRGLLPARMELPVGSGLAEFSIPSLKPGEQHEDLFAVPTNRRSVIVAGPATSVRGDQVGLLRRAVRWTDPVDLFVHPVTVPLSPSAAGLVRDLEGQVTKKITNNDLSFHALRAYAPGDDRRYVHWRTSARTGRLMVRQFEETRRSQLTIVHSVFSGYYASDEEFELSVSVMASLAAQVARDGTQMSVVTETRRLHTHSPMAVLDDSCRLEMVSKKYANAREFARDVTRRLPPPSVLAVIAGSRMSTAEFRSIEMLFPADASMICFRVDDGAQPALATVSRMQVATLGALGDLPKILRRTGS